MGVKQLNRVLEILNRELRGVKPVFMSPIHLSEFKKNGAPVYVAVDASLMIHKIVTSIRKSSGCDMKSVDGNLTSHLYGIMYKIIIFLENNIIPIFVFDGKPTILKSKTTEERKQVKLKAQTLLTETPTTSTEFKKIISTSYSISKLDIENLKIMLSLMGIPYIQSPEEADVVCAWLTYTRRPDNNYYAKGVCSEDTDMIPLGARYVFKNMSGGLKKNDTIVVINYDRLLDILPAETRVSKREQLIDLCVLLGNDYCTNISKVGFQTVIKLIMEYGTFDNIITQIKMKRNNLTSIDIDNMECMKLARQYYLESGDKLQIQLTESNYKLAEMCQDEFRHFLVKNNFNIETVNTQIRKILDLTNKIEKISNNFKYDIVQLSVDYPIIK